MTNANDLAYPADWLTKVSNTKEELKAYSGLSKREYFAAMVMIGLCASKDTDAFGEMGSVASQAVIAADALITQLNKTEPK